MTFKQVKIMDKDQLQVIWEQLNGVLYDLEQGTPADAIEAVEDCIQRLEALGVGN